MKHLIFDYARDRVYPLTKLYTFKYIEIVESYRVGSWEYQIYMQLGLRKVFLAIQPSRKMAEDWIKTYIEGL